MCSLLFLLLTCGEPHPTLAPDDGETIPVDATLYLFQPTWLEPAWIAVLGDDGQPIAHMLEPIGDHRDTYYPAYRARLYVPDKVREVRVRSSDGVTHRYPVDRQWRVPRAGAVVLGESIRIRGDEECTPTDAMLFSPSEDAPAYRIEWAATRDDFRHRRINRAVVPRSYVSYVSSARAKPAARLAIGRVPCGGVIGTHLPRTTAPIYVSVVALYADGSESPASLEPTPLPDPSDWVPSFRRVAFVADICGERPGLLNRLLTFVLFPFAVGYIVTRTFLAPLAG
jgi:hypothetical protein